MKQIRRSLLGALSLLAITAAPLTVATAVPNEEPTEVGGVNAQNSDVDENLPEDSENLESAAEELGSAADDSETSKSTQEEATPEEPASDERSENTRSAETSSAEEKAKTANVSWGSGQGNNLSMRVSELAGEAEKDGSGALFRGEKNGTVGDAFLYDPSYTHREGESVLRKSFYDADEESTNIIARFENADMKDVEVYVYCGNTAAGFIKENRVTGTLPFKNIPNFFMFEVPVDTLKALRAGVCYVTTATDAANAAEPMEGFDQALELTFYETGGDLPGIPRKGELAKQQVVEDATQTAVAFSGTYLRDKFAASPVWSLHYHYTDAATGQPASAQIVSGEDVVAYQEALEGSLGGSSNWQAYEGTADMTEYAKQSAGCQGFFAIHLNGKSLWNPDLIAERERVTGETFPSALEGMARFKQDVIFDQALCETPEQEAAPSDDPAAKPKADKANSLAKTGVNSGVLGAVAVVLGAAGAGLFLAGRSRRNA
ncbi:MAG: hypothetical protein Q4P05_08600 [Actinomycetaceae bacterium]|nr:hypothetical protein [Actinomycetaceae bacterium]